MKKKTREMHCVIGNRFSTDCHDRILTKRTRSPTVYGLVKNVKIMVSSHCDATKENERVRRVAITKLADDPNAIQATTVLQTTEDAVSK